MTGRTRWLIPGAALGISLILSLLLRDVVYQAVVTPMAYVLWYAGLFYSAVPQLAKWILLTAILMVAVVWTLIPDWRASPRKAAHSGRAEGQVEVLARWIHRAHQSNYFKWQLANRLARVSRALAATADGKDDTRPPTDEVDKYLTAGINNSFVDFPGPRNGFRSHIPTPLDIDPTRAVEYLESQMEINRAGRP